MIQVRDVYQLKVGRIDQAVNLFQRMPAVAGRTGEQAYQQHALTDISGPMYTFVSEPRLLSLAEWESGRTQVLAPAGFTVCFTVVHVIE